MAINEGISYGPPINELTIEDIQLIFEVGISGLGENVNLKITDSLDDGVSLAFAVTHCVETPPALPGIGAGITLQAENGSGTVAPAALLSGILTDVTDGAEEGAFEITCITAGGTSEVDLRVEPGGIGVRSGTVGIEGSAETVITASAGITGDNACDIELQGSTTSSTGEVAALRIYQKTNAIAKLEFFRDGGEDDGGLVIQTADAGLLEDRLTFTAGGDVVFGTSLQMDTATAGFMYVQTTSTAPTGVPVGHTNRVPLVFDLGTDRLYVYNGSGWIRSGSFN